MADELQDRLDRARLKSRLAAAFEAKASTLAPVDLSIARSKNDAFGEFLRDRASERQEGETDEEMFRRQFGGLTEQERPGTAEGIARGAFQGLTFGAGDEIVGAAAAALDPLVRGDQGKSFGERQEAFQSREREQLGQFREDQPALALGSEVAGAIPTAALPLGAATRAGSLGAGIARGAAVGAGQGATFGFNAGEGGLGPRLMQALQGGAMGGAVGAAAPIVGAGVRNVVNRVAGGRAANQAGMPRSTFETVQRAMSADDSFTGAGAQRIAAAGDDAMLADSGRNARALLDTALQRTGPAANRARQAIENRAVRSATTIRTALDNNLGKPLGQQSTQRLIRDSTKGARNAAYERAYSRPIDYGSRQGREIERIVRERVPQAAINEANNLMRIEGAQSRQIVARVADDGSILYERLPDVRQLDYITRSINTVAQRDEAAGALGGQTPTGRALSNLSRDLRSLVREAVPEYGVALDTAADAISARNALLLGRQALSARVTREEVADAVRGMSRSERLFLAQGVRVQVDEAMANVRRTLTDPNMDARQAVQAVRDLSSDAAREKIGLIVGREKAAALFDQIDQATAGLDLRAALAENSKTFARTATNDAISAQTDEGVVNALRSGEPIGAARRAIQVVGGRTAADKARISEEAMGGIADAMTQQGPQAANTLRLLQQAQQVTGPRTDLTQALIEQAIRRNTAVTGPLINR